MPLIDDRGRLFGKVNLIDFALIVFVLVLVPVGYGGYLLFRMPTPRLVSVTPNPLVFKKGDQRVRISGENLRPFMRATVGKIDAKAFLVERRDAAEIVFDELPIGTYDLAVYDFTEEVARLSNAITIAPPPLPPSQIVGRFIGPNAATSNLDSGVKLGPADQPVEIVASSAAANGERRATLRFSCAAAAPCAMGGAPLEPGRTVSIPAKAGGEALRFVVDEVRADGLWVDVTVRMFAISEVMGLMKPGDVDRGMEPDGPHMPHYIRGAVLRSVEPVQPSQGSVALTFAQGLTDIGPFGGHVTGAGSLPLMTRLATVSLPVQRVGSGWRYRDQIIRTGGGLAFETSDYFVRGFILRVVMNEPPARERGE
jgi:uncharacterized protein DUF4330